MKPKILVCLAGLLILAAQGGRAQTSGTVNAEASWRQRYTLGPGDVLNFGLYGYPDLSRDQVFIQPDGTITYLQAQNIPAQGLTIDELRTSLEQKLGQYYKHPHVIVAPVELRSKKYFILGKVIDNGAYAMDRPTTLLEAVARARGIETGLFEQNTVELADLARSFIIRHNQRLQVDFQRLFFQGDMSQNIELEPGDFIYFPSNMTNEVYVLGAVATPGVLGFTPNLTVVGAITRRSGFSDDAYRQRVLVVRGSLQKPQTFIVDTNAILKGRRPDFPLQPKDIVYVNVRPWKFAEELLENAVSAFAQGAVTNWTGAHVGPFITQPVLPQFNIR